MPKINPLRMLAFTHEFGREYFSIKGEKLFCKLCHIEFKGERRTFIKNHCNSKTHSQNVRLHARNDHKDELPSSTSRVSDTSSQFQFYKICAKSWFDANLPFNKLHNPAFKAFLEKYTGGNFLVRQLCASTICHHFMTIF